MGKNQFGQTKGDETFSPAIARVRKETNKLGNNWGNYKKKIKIRIQLNKYCVSL